MWYFAKLILPLLIFSSCGKSKVNLNLFSEFSNEESISQNIDSLIVMPVYPVNGSNWNDYIKDDDGLVDRFHQSDDACDGTETGDQRACIHGGEKKKVILSTESECQNLSIQDNLDVFNWRCSEEAGEVIFYTTGLKETKGLKDLVESNGWKTNLVKVYKSSTLIGQSSHSQWWTNNVTPATPNPGTGIVTLNNAGTIYTISADADSSGYNINNDKVSFVTLPGATLSYDDTTGLNCNSADGEVAGADKNCLISVGAQKFVWVEGDFKGLKVTTSGNMDGIFFYNSLFSRVHGTTVYLTKTNGILFSESPYNYISSTKVAGASADGIQLSNSDYSRLHNIYVAGCSGNGIDFPNSAYTVATSIYAYTNNQSGIRAHCGTNSNIFSGFVIANNDDTSYSGSFTGTCNLRLTLSHFTIVNGDVVGLNVDQTNDYAINQGVVSNAQTGLRIDNNARNTRISQLVLTNHSIRGIHASNSGTVNRYLENLIMGTNTIDCNVVGGGSEGIIHDTCTSGPVAGADGSNIYGGFTNSTATLRTNRDALDFFVGKVLVDDTENSSDTGSAQLGSTIDDWFSFETPFRGWGLDGGVFPATDHRTECVGSFQCIVWDFRAKDTGSNPILNTSGDGSSQNSMFEAGSACPPSIDGNKTMTDSNPDPNTFLMNAREIIGDEIGDENGLCESNESCIYSPNFGAYQGEGDYLAGGTCNFQDGVVFNVKMYAYPINGVP